MANMKLAPELRDRDDLKLVLKRERAHRAATRPKLPPGVKVTVVEFGRKGPIDLDDPTRHRNRAASRGTVLPPGARPQKKEAK